MQTALTDATCSTWARRTNDGRTMLIAFVNGNVLPEGVNDAVVATTMLFHDMRDETASGRGKAHIDIIEDGWKSVPSSAGEAIRELL